MSILAVTSSKNQLSLVTGTQLVLPPTSNRGAENTKTNTRLQFAVDWCSFTIPSVSTNLERGITPKDVFDVLGLDAADFAKLDRGMHGYTNLLTMANISVMYNDPVDKQGIHIEISGQGCRYYEQLGHEWLSLWSLVVDMNGKFTRLDLSIDDKVGIFDMDMVEEHIRTGQTTSRLRKRRIMAGYDSDGNSEGKTAYIGSPQSRLMIRIYDKAKERGLDGHWVRTELQLRDERATVAVSLVLGGMQIGEVTSGVLRNYLMFKIRDDNQKNRSRWEVTSWWKEFLGEVEKIQITTSKPERTIEQVQEWVIDQLAPTMRMLQKYLGQEGLIDFVDLLCIDGDRRFGKRHEVMLNNALEVRYAIEAAGQSATDPEFLAVQRRILFSTGEILN